AATGSPASNYGAFPEIYQEIATTWLKKYSLDSSRIEWLKEKRAQSSAFSHKQVCVTIYVEVAVFALCSLH
ncbi:MAG TPA: hypothetical protein VIU85_03805, partial [Chthoniobacterales bacterium]